MKAPVAVTMIVRDEAPVIARCLDSIEPYVEAIAIVDTGSTDDTMEIASRYTKYLSTFYGANEGFSKEGALLSFADARNHALFAAEPFNKTAIAPYPFAMWLDASDVVMGGENIASIIEESKMQSVSEFDGACHLLVDTQMLDQKGRISRRFGRERVFCRGKYRWQGRLHEVLTPLSGPSHEIPCPPNHLAIQRPFRERGKKDPDRNLRILRNLVEKGEEPTSRNVFYLGREYADRGEYAAARKWLLHYVAISQYEDEKCSALLLLSELAAARLDLDEALQHALLASVVKQTWREPLIQAGKILYQQASRGQEFRRNRERAQNLLLAAIEMKPTPTKMITAPHPEIEAYRLIGCCHMDLGEKNEARHCFEDALKIDPEDEACKNLIERVR